ncbi:MAG TPA: FAD-binding oxidoreductase [Mycobacteriales bacterium]|nr:FAD-binding oxidoreductase [Mycobacteriales bacterium]
MDGSPTRSDYERRVDRLRRDLLALPAAAPVRLRKPTSNLFRPRQQVAHGLDASGFDGVLDIDTDNRTADVLGMTIYEHLVDATLPHGFMPLVVPQLKTITLGGAVTGLGIESTSFRNGCPHESVLELDVLTGRGEIVTASATNEHRDLFFGFPNSYGSLGYALRLRIELEPVQPFVHLRHLRFDTLDACAAAIDAICTDASSYDGEPVHFLDGTWFSRDEIYLTVGSWCTDARQPSDYTGRQIYYRSLRQRREDWLTTRDYLWRWDTDWFWCSRAFGAQRPLVRAVWPKRWLRSDTYWKLVIWERRYGVKRRLDAMRGKPEVEYVIQDVEIPLPRLGEFLSFLDRQTSMSPVWLCPLRQRDPDAVWELYPLEPTATYVNVGFWGGVDLPPGEHEPFHNRAIERAVADLGGRKSLYSTAFYPEEEFWANYGGSAYELLKKTYDPDGRLLDLYAKTVRRH